MAVDYKTPGVYRENVVPPPPPTLATGVPGFVGFASAAPELLNRPVAVRRKDEFDAMFAPAVDATRPASYLADAVAGFFLNGGQLCYVVAVEADGAGGAAARAAALKTGLSALAPAGDVDLVAVPDAMTLYASEGDASDNSLDEAEVAGVQAEMLRHCASHGGRLAVLDALPGGGVADWKRQRGEVTAGQLEPTSGALYCPWIRIADGAGERLVPPSGHVAGIIARSDAAAGVFKAPANEEVRGALDLEVVLDDAAQAELNPAGVNCLRAFPGRGIRIWGARTVSNEPDWRYVNVRRLFLTLNRWIDANMTWAAFEPNTARLWVRIRRELTAYLTDLWRAGALVGQKAEEAFYVKCDSETNTAGDVEAGRAVTEIGLATSAPAEFVVVRVINHSGVEPR